MMPKELHNQDALQYATAQLANIQAMCKPLLQATPIKTVAYFRFYPDGSYVFLCNHIEWVAYCLEHIQCNDDTVLGQEIYRVGMEDFHCYLWPLTQRDYLLDALYAHDLWHGISLFCLNADQTVELWGFSGSRTDEQLINFYWDHLDTLKLFTVIFNQQAGSIIHPPTTALASYRHFNAGNPVYRNNQSPMHKFIKQTPLNRLSIFHDHKEYWILYRQALCLQEVSLGMTAKEIANVCHVSHRTVEKNIELIKAQLSVNKKDDLMRIYRNSRRIWF